MDTERQRIMVGEEEARARQHAQSLATITANLSQTFLCDVVLQHGPVEGMRRFTNLLSKIAQSESEERG